MLWLEKSTGDTLEINLFDNQEQPMPYRDISKDNTEIVKGLTKKLAEIENKKSDFFSSL